MTLFAAATVLFALLIQAPPLKPVPATFNGVFHGIEKGGYLLMEVEGGQELRMFIIGSTKFIRDGKPAKSSQFRNGDAITVDAERDAAMNMVALKVEAVKAKPAPSQ